MANSLPPWAGDELILAMDLFVRKGREFADHEDLDVIEVSEVLRQLGKEQTRNNKRFRSPSGVAWKLQTFVRISKGHAGSERGLAAAKRVWDQFDDHRDELHAVARQLRAFTASGLTFSGHQKDDQEDDEGVLEGSLVLRVHRDRERKASAVERKKNAALWAHGRLSCEVCGFDFAASYGEAGHGFIECHHVRLLSDTGRTLTRQSDLALVCSNCHRMLHRRPWPSIDELRHRLK
jgi:5-methylcytosine-specific restriction protein A